MSHTTIYTIERNGDVIKSEEIDNAYKICMLIWTIMFEFYYDYFELPNIA